MIRACLNTKQILLLIPKNYLSIMHNLIMSSIMGATTAASRHCGVLVDVFNLPHFPCFNVVQLRNKAGLCAAWDLLPLVSSPRRGQTVTQRRGLRPLGRLQVIKLIICSYCTHTGRLFVMKTFEFFAEDNYEDTFTKKTQYKAKVMKISLIILYLWYIYN